ncbi:hypothetical protein HAX54_004723 [Datura stramonium]|uniref:Gnk2-homologous domain-containing protein n=1 Tax=Datura stramonium TaxID=4076 RepID=A0ABS8T8Q2_DATST|nr:hypothetical protein [Datura stramonium]
MGFLKWLTILIFQFYNLFDLSIAQPNFISYACADFNKTEFSPNSAYDTNLNTLLSALSRNMDGDGFYNTSIGQDPDKVSVIAQCRGDMESQICRDCINNATRKILEVCPYKKSAFGYYDECTYSNESIIGTVSLNPLVFIYNTANVSSPDEFMQEDLRTLLESLQIRASEGGKRKFARNTTRGPDFQTIHALVQCTADLSAQDCFNCLRNGYERLPTCPCYGKLAANVLMPSCNFIFQTYPFSNELPGTQAPPQSAPPPPPIRPSPPPPLPSGNFNFFMELLASSSTYNSFSSPL